MKKIRTIIALIAVVAAMAIPGVSAQGAAPVKSARLQADSVFIALPHNVLEILNPSTRMDMLDYYRNDSIYKAPNLVNGESYLTDVTADYLKVQLTDVSRMEVKILPRKGKGDIAAVSYTVDSTGAQADSQLFFFDGDMQPLEAKKLFRQPEIKRFLHIDKGSVTSEKELVDMVQFPTIAYSFSPDNTLLTARLTVGEYMDTDDYNIFKLFLLPQLTYRWTGSKFELEKTK